MEKEGRDGDKGLRLLAVRCPSNIRMSVQASLPIHAAVLRGQLAAGMLAVRCPSNIRMSVQASLPIHTDA